MVMGMGWVSRMGMGHEWVRGEVEEAGGCWDGYGLGEMVGMRIGYMGGWRWMG